MKEIIESKPRDIKLVITGSDEPNNGRMLWVADIYVSSKIETEKYFGSWNRLNRTMLLLWTKEPRLRPGFFLV